jgi:8-oxo-dGTP pyrophosphatase MutT (NUDIX family)
VLVRAGKLLACQTLGSPILFLPGGHVEFGESGVFSLAREIEEEMGRKARVGRFLGVVEHTFLQKGERHCEVNLVYAYTIPGLSARRAPEPAEDHIRFHWLPLASLRRSRLEPAPLRRLLPLWLADRSRTPRLDSTYPASRASALPT